MEKNSKIILDNVKKLKSLRELKFAIIWASTNIEYGRPFQRNIYPNGLGERRIEVSLKNGKIRLSSNKISATLHDHQETYAFIDMIDNR